MRFKPTQTHLKQQNLGFSVILCASRVFVLCWRAWIKSQSLFSEEQNKSVSVPALLELAVLLAPAATRARTSGRPCTRHVRKGEQWESSSYNSSSLSSAVPAVPKTHTVEDKSLERDVSCGCFQSFYKSLKGTFMFLVNSTAVNAAKFAAIK